MEIRELQPAEYATIFEAKVPHIYNTVAFSELNRSKTEAVHYLGFYDGTRPRLGIILGERDGKLLSPFSAPFGGFSQPKPQTAAFVFEAVSLLKDYGRKQSMSIRITLPPAIYSTSLTSLTASALALHGKLLWNDVNYHRELDFHEAPEEKFSQKARKNRKVAAETGFLIEKIECPDIESLLRAYSVIQDNRKSLGYPLRMTFEDVAETAGVVGAFVFIGRQKEDAVAALVYRATTEIAQVIYWGDRIAVRGQNLMNLFAAEVMNRCRDMGFRVLDIGPSSSEGIPAAGLCRFKESLGCTATVKPTFEL